MAYQIIGMPYFESEPIRLIVPLENQPIPMFYPETILDYS